MQDDPLRRGLLPLATTVAGYAYQDGDLAAWDRSGAQIRRRGRLTPAAPLDPPPRDLHTIASVPIFRHLNAFQLPPEQRGEPVAILNLDAAASFWPHVENPNYQARLFRHSTALTAILGNLVGWRRFDGFDE